MIPSTTIASERKKSNKPLLVDPVLHHLAAIIQFHTTLHKEKERDITNEKRDTTFVT